MDDQAAVASNHDQAAVDWLAISRLLLLSRNLDHIEETELVPARQVFNQFSARGHDFAQILLGSRLTHTHDGATGYYRSRPLALALGLTPEDAFSAPLARSEGYSDGRDIGVVCNLPGAGRLARGATLLPMSGGVGAQYTPAVGWAQAITYRSEHLKQAQWRGAIAVATGGDASASTNGFWAALNIATTLKLPMLFYMEDNGYGISVPAPLQTPGGDHVANLACWPELKIVDGDGTDPEQTPALIDEAVEHCRAGHGACLLRLRVPRLCGHTFQDTQTYKTEELITQEQARDPLPKLQRWLEQQGTLNATGWADLEQQVEREVRAALEAALARPEPDPAGLRRYVMAEKKRNGSNDLPIMGGLAADQHRFPEANSTPQPSGQRINLITAIRRTLDAELKSNPRVLVFGEDVGPKGGVHGATLGLAQAHGEERVFDTSLSEEGIIGRSVGMAVAGLMPVPEIQFRKYAEPAAEQITDAGTMRWRTANRFACPMVVRVPGGFARRGDPWHSMCDEVEWAHKVGWQVAMPSHAEDAVGLLRAALRGDNPTMFFEHRHLYDNAWSRRPYPGDEYLLPFGQAAMTVAGDRLTIVTWGAMVERCETVARRREGSIEVLDLRTISPWDKEGVLESVKKTGRCLIVHEDNLTAGFGAEVAAVLADELFWALDAPVRRLTMPDIPNPHNLGLLNAAVPGEEEIDRAAAQAARAMKDLDIVFSEQTEGTTARLNRWLVSVGDAVQPDQPVAELETDKVTVEIAAPGPGYLAEQLVELDQELEPGTVLGRLTQEPTPGAVDAPLTEVLFVTEDNEGTAATLGRWLVEPGQQVSAGQPLVEVETDKVMLEIVAPDSGTMHSLAAKTGQALSPGQLLAQLAVTEAAQPALPPDTDPRGAQRISPAVRKLMEKYAITSLKVIPGTGEGGRVTRDNLLSWLEQRAPEAGIPEGHRVPHSAMRRAIARNMMDSIKKSPHVTSLFEADMSAVAAHRQAHRTALAEQGIKLTYTAYFVAAAAAAMRAVPQVNSRFHSDHLQLYDDINIGVGTALGEEGLIVPVIQRVQDRSLAEIAADLGAKTERARSGTLNQEDLRGGTFTISNHGVSGSLLAAPIIINQPQVAILGVGKLEKRVRVVEADGEDQIQIVPSCYVTLSIDHRALDAFQTNAWLAAFVDALEQWPADQPRPD